MAEKHLKINTSRLSDDKDSISGCITDMQKRADRIKQIQKSLNSMWEGESKKKFDQTLSENIETAESIIAAIKDIWSYESTAKNTYEQCEKNVKSVVDSIRI